MGQTNTSYEAKLITSRMSHQSAAKSAWGAGIYSNPLEIAALHLANAALKRPESPVYPILLCLHSGPLEQDVPSPPEHTFANQQNYTCIWTRRLHGKGVCG